MSQSHSALRITLTSLLLWLSFLSACLFYGIGENLILLFASTGFLLLSIALIPPQRFIALFSRSRSDGWWCLWVLGVLLISYHLVTISPDGGFAGSWVLASAPLWYLSYAAVGDRSLVRRLLIATITVFAVISALRFVTTGQRAFEPLIDPNNYASLLYLFWIPLTHRILVSHWQGRFRIVQLLPGIALTLVLAMAIFATSSRVGSLIVAAAFAGWLFLGLGRKLNLRLGLVLAGSTAAVYLLVLLLAPEFSSSAYNGEDIVSGLDIRSALNTSALQMFLQAPLTGTGVSTFSLLYPLYRLSGDQSTAGIFVHNDYLQLLAETGPWLVLALILVAAATVRRLWLGLFSTDPDALRKFGLAMAVAAVLAHAMVNFVFYVLPLGIVFAVVCAALFAPSGPNGSQRLNAGKLTASDAAYVSPIAKASWWSGLLLAVVGWGYLGLDVVTQGIFGAQPAVGFVRDIRSDGDAMLRFSEQAQKLNSRRVTPVLAQALIMAATLEQVPEAAPDKAVIRDKFRQALAMDPFSPLTYEQYARFLQNALDAELLATLRPNEVPDVLLLRAVQLDVRRVATIFDLLQVYDRLGRSEQAWSMLRDTVYPWLERVQWSSSASAEKLIKEMRRRATAADDHAFLLRLERRAGQISGLSQKPSEHWLKTWMQRWWNS
jgi:O-antigen ligase